LFEPLGEDNASQAQIVSWASVGISFLFRPLGAIIAGHLGDKYGRQLMLFVTLIGMSVATAAICLLPSYAALGLGAPIMLILLRVLQGFSAGGEWGVAALMAVEHAPKSRRSFFGSYPQIGVPLGMILATAFMFIITTYLTEEQFLV